MVVAAKKVCMRPAPGQHPQAAPNVCDYEPPQYTMKNAFLLPRPDNSASTAKNLLGFGPNSGILGNFRGKGWSCSLSRSDGAFRSTREKV